ncbi:MAG: class I SAM-dependent methyltransferase [Actinomycetota bacterium]
MNPGKEMFEQHNEFQRNYFEQADHRTLARAGSVYLRRHVDRMMRFAGIEPGMRVLEVGCGLGRYTFLLAERGIKVEGLDLSPQLLDRLERINDGRYSIPTHCFDLVDAPPEMNGAFDAVVGFFVLHHVHELKPCFEVAARLVKPGGSVAFLEPNPLNPLYYVQITLTPEMRWEGERGMLRMRPAVLFPAMSGAGLGRPSLERFGFFPPFVTNLPGALKLEDVLEKVPLWRPALPFQLFGGRS